MKRNLLRELLNEGKPTLGTHVITPWPGMVEVIGQSGAFDYIEYVGEYSPFSLELMDNFGWNSGTVGFCQMGDKSSSSSF